jgi:hypothetical protein
MSIVRRYFLDHPTRVGESYTRHMIIAARFGWRMTQGALACFVHALIPGLCTHTGSRIARSLSQDLDRRTGLR